MLICEEEVEEGKKDLVGEDNGEFKENEFFELMIVV